MASKMYAILFFAIQKLDFFQISDLSQTLNHLTNALLSTIQNPDYRISDPDFIDA